MRLLTTLLMLCLALASSPMRAESRYSFIQRDTGGRLDWGADGRVAFDRLDAQGWFQLWTMNADGTQKKCLTCDTGFPKLHNGNPAWHSAGDYIAYQSLDQKIPVPFWGKLYKLYTNPGGGVNNNIWIVSAGSGRAWQMTDLGKGKGVLHPHFSHDGTKLLWAEMTSTKPMPLGTWVMRLADFKEIETKAGTRPRLSNIRTLTPGSMQWYETHNFSPDDSEILFTGAHKDGDRPDIYKYSLHDGTLAALTNEKEQSWDEHAHLSPDGTKIIWMSSKDNGGKQNNPFEPTDWWLMNADGSGKKRLTFFNRKGSPEYTGEKYVAADISWSPDGTQALGYLQIGRDTMSRPGGIVRFGVE